MKAMLRLHLIGIALAAVVAGLLVPLPAEAQQPPDRLKSLTISVWLEYDRPGALYILRGELHAGTSLPARLIFRVPARSGGPSSTAGIDANGQFRYVRPTQQQDGESIIVEYETSWPRFQFEYYDDALLRQDQKRELEFSYRADYAIEQLALEVKEPYGATSFGVDPAASSQSQGEDGLTVHRRDLGAMAPGQEVQWKVSYNKSDPRLSREALGLQELGSSPYEAGPGVVPPAQGQNRIVWALLALLGIGALGGLWLALRSGNGQPDAAPALNGGRRGRKRPAKGLPEPPQVRPAKYCHRCGTALAKNDAFCRRCGTKRRGT